MSHKQSAQSKAVRDSQREVILDKLSDKALANYYCSSPEIQIHHHTLGN
ncbi:MAG TPA: hypothetical protein VK999_02795 [Methylotenera sp.]|nr:hypothetical protein [Methylotenera sp.]